MESNKSFNTLLGRYLHLSMTNESTDTLNKDSLSILFSRPSFKELVKFMLIKDREDLNIFYPESHETWDDYKINLLYNCTDTTILYSIANDLLLKKNVLGLLGIWNNCRVSKLPAYRQFVKWCCEKRQQEIIVMLVIINHNNGNIIEEKRLLKYVKTHNLYPRLRLLLQKKRIISYYDYYIM
ncbi:hypothetical protein [Prevotella jejuni]